MIRKCTGFFIIAISLLLFSSSSQAQISIGLNAGVGMQLSDWSQFENVEKISVPAILGVYYDLDGLDVLDAEYSVGLSGGYMNLANGLFKDQMAHENIGQYQFSASSVPIMLTLNGQRSSFYGELGLGANFWSWAFETEDLRLKDYQQGTNLIVGFGAGYVHELSNQMDLNIGLQYYLLNFGFPRDSEYTYNFYIPSVFRSQYLGLQVGVKYQL